MTDERVLQILRGLLERKLVGVMEEEAALTVACLVMQRKVEGRLVDTHQRTLSMGDRKFQLYRSVVQGLAARGDVPDEALLARALEIVDAAP